MEFKKPELINSTNKQKSSLIVRDIIVNQPNYGCIVIDSFKIFLSILYQMVMFLIRQGSIISMNWH